MKGNAYVETGGKEEKLEINEVKCVGLLCVCVCVWSHNERFGMLVPQPGIEPLPLQQKQRVLTAGPPWKIQVCSF